MTRRLRTLSGLASSEEKRLILEVPSIARGLNSSGLMSYKVLRSVKSRLKTRTGVRRRCRPSSIQAAVDAMQQRRFRVVARVLEHSVPSSASFGRFRTEP